jgi:hypothetical protein
MKKILFIMSCCFILSQTGSAQSSGNTENGFNLQSQAGRIVFVPENSKIRVKQFNGYEMTGILTGADSSSIHLTPMHGGEQVIVESSTIRKMTVFHDHGYFTLFDGDGSMSGLFNGCGNNWSAVGVVVVVGALAAVTAGELIVDGVIDLANDEHYDLVNGWKVSGPVRGTSH